MLVVKVFSVFVPGRLLALHPQRGYAVLVSAPSLQPVKAAVPRLLASVRRLPKPVGATGSAAAPFLEVGGVRTVSCLLMERACQAAWWSVGRGGLAAHPLLLHRLNFPHFSVGL